MPMTNLEKLGSALKATRKKKKLTQQQLADMSHISLKHLQSIEKGLKNPSFEVLLSLVHALDISIDALFYIDSEDDEKAIIELKHSYLSCSPQARKILLNATRALAKELKETL